MNDTKTKSENQKDYILKDSDSKYYKAKDLKGLSKWEVQLARNEIYARHGRKFTTDEVREYFEGKDWYHGTVEEVEDSELNKYEIANRDMIQKYEKSKGWRQEEEVMFCENCGKKLPEKAAFCVNCGEKVQMRKGIWYTLSQECFKETMKR